MAITFAESIGSNAYSIAAIGQQANPPGFKRRSTPTPVGNIKFTGNPIPANGLQFNVPAGAPVLLGTLRDDNGNVPQGVTTTITRPDGTVLTASPYTDPNLYVVISNGSITDMMVVNPMPGNWVVNVTAPGITTDFAFFMSTMPTTDVQLSFQETLPSLVFQIDHGQGFSLSCQWCTIGAYVTGGILAVIVLTAAAVGATLLTFATAGAALAPLTAIGITGEVAVNAFFAGLFTATSSSTDVTIGIVAAFICQWLNVCAAPAVQQQAAPAVATVALA